MKLRRFVVDRSEVGSEEIQKRQNLEEIIQGQRDAQPRFFRNRWFLSGLALSLLMLVWISLHLTKDAPKEEKSHRNSIPVKLKNSITTSLKADSEKGDYLLSKSVTPALSGTAQRHKFSKEFRENTMITKTLSKRPLEVPNIGGIYSGSIKASELLKSEIIESGSEVPISSFMVGYFNGTTDVMEFVEGNSLSEKLKRDLVEYNIGKTFFITEMYGLDNEGRMRMLPPVNLIILPN
jgi:hypothetical protein